MILTMSNKLKRKFKSGIQVEGHLSLAGAGRDKLEFNIKSRANRQVEYKINSPCTCRCLLRMCDISQCSKISC